MKRILSVILSCLFLINLLLIVGCNESNTGNGVQTEGETSTSPQDTTITSQPIAIKTVNGMTATQLYENFVNDYENANTYDISIRTSITSEGTPINSAIDLKFSNNAMFIKVDASDAKMECWFFNDISYLNINGEKYKMSGVTANDIFGEGFIELTLGSVMSDIDQTTYLEKLKNIQLYLYNSEYYYTLLLTDKEAENSGIEAKGFSETVVFDAQGKVKKIVASSNTENVTVILNSYGDMVNISVPDDADSYMEQTIPEGDGNEQDTQPQPPSDNAGDQDPLLYAEYQAVFDAIKNATNINMSISTNSSTILFYATDGKSECVKTLETDGYYQLWYVNGKGYACESNGTAHTTPVTADFLSYFEAARAQIDFVAELQLHGNDMNDFSISQEYSRSKFTLSHNNNDGTIDFYDIVSDYTYGKVDGVRIIVTRSLNGVNISSIEYKFHEIDSVYSEKIVAPI